MVGDISWSQQSMFSQANSNKTNVMDMESLNSWINKSILSIKVVGKKVLRKVQEDRLNLMVQNILELGCKEKDKVMELLKLLSLNIILEIFIMESRVVMVLKSSEMEICMLDNMLMESFMAKVSMYLLRNLYVGKSFTILRRFYVRSKIRLWKLGCQSSWPKKW